MSCPHSTQPLPPFDPTTAPISKKFQGLIEIKMKKYKEIQGIIINKTKNIMIFINKTKNNGLNEGIMGLNQNFETMIFTTRIVGIPKSLFWVFNVWGPNF